MSKSKYEKRQVVLGPPWTDERVETLKTMWLQGKSGREIAFELGGGTTRCAVIGKAHRTGLPPHPRRHAMSGKRVKSEKSAGQPNLLAHSPAAPLHPSSEFTRPPSDNKPAKNLNELAAREAICAERREELKGERIEQVPASVGSKPCTIDKLKAKFDRANCHWPLGGKVKDPHEYFYCGAPAQLEQGKNPPRPYCPYHTVMRNYGKENAERFRRRQETVHNKQDDLAVAS